MGFGLGLTFNRVVGLIWINLDLTVTLQFPGQNDFRKFMFSLVFRASEEIHPTILMKAQFPIFRHVATLGQLFCTNDTVAFDKLLIFEFFGTLVFSFFSSSFQEETLISLVFSFFRFWLGLV